MRYFKASLIVGLISTFIVGALYGAGFTRTLDIALRSLFKLPDTGIPPLSGGQFIAIFAFAWAIAWTSIDIVRTSLKVVVAILTIFLLFIGSWTLALYGSFFSPFPTIAATFASLLLSLAYGQTQSGQRKRQLHLLFGQRLTRKQLQSLVDSETPITFEGKRMECSLLVCEITNHAHLMNLEPADYIAMTNSYLRAASDYLVDVGGYLDECDGESVRVIFGAPCEDPEHATKAIQAALELVTRLDQVNRDCDAQWHRRFDYCISVHSGEVIAGAYGGTRLGSFSVAGEAVEFARRLCSAAAIYGTRILTTADTFGETREAFETRPMDLITEPVTNRRIEIYEVLSPRDGLSPERRRSRDHFWKGVIYYREKSWDKAVDELTKARISGLPDAPLDFYVQRIERARRGQAETTRHQNALVNVI